MTHRFKDGKLLPINHNFQPDPLKYKLTILEVNVNHAGNYTFALSNTKHGLYKNLTIQLIVNGESLGFMQQFQVPVSILLEENSKRGYDRNYLCYSETGLLEVLFGHQKFAD